MKQPLVLFRRRLIMGKSGSLWHVKVGIHWATDTRMLIALLWAIRFNIWYGRR